MLFIAVCVFQDKTFGLKNKKGAKQQKFIKNVTQQVKYGQQSARQVVLPLSVFFNYYLYFDPGILYYLSICSLSLRC